jgi:hypothetical protein
VIAVATVEVNRAPVLTLWATIVARRAGFSEDEALTLGRAVAGLTAQTKGRRLGIYTKAPVSEGEKVARAREALDAQELEFMKRVIPIVREGDEIRALSKAMPIQPASVRKYLTSKFGDTLPLFTERLTALANAFSVDELMADAMDLYTRFRPTVPPGVEGWGKKAVFDSTTIDALMPPGTSSSA